ncbi:MAG: 50S ribosomal protein L17 [Chlorobi bacterium]|nr:50S ribosomal protein L17 [Chlorobiota bacterium]
MYHLKKKNPLGRTASHRKALLRNLAIELIKHKRIKTTVAKAKELRRFIEPILNRAKEDTTPNRRYAFKHLQNKEAVKILFSDIAPKIMDRNGGYTRVLRLGLWRRGDNAEMAMIELVDFNEALLEATKEKSAEAPTKKRRRRRGRKKKTTEEESTTTKAEAKESGSKDNQDSKEVDRGE